MPHSHEHHEMKGVSDGGLIAATALNLLLTVVEVVIGVMAGSVALLADALHNFSDCGALLIALIARRIARRQADSHFTFGYRRAELIGALINLTTLILIALYLSYESVARLIEPTDVLGPPVMIAASVALIVDVATVLLLWSMSRGSLNVRAAFVHNLTDALASLAVLAGGAAIWLWQWTIIDPLIGLAIAAYVIVTALPMMKKAASILMLGAPPGIDVNELADRIESIAGVDETHHLHLWQLDEHHVSLEAHIVLSPDHTAEMETVKQAIKTLLAEEFDIEHSTLEFELAATTAEHETARIARK